MYTIYHYLPNSTAANISSDLGKILSGTIDKDLLSASCNKDNTTILSTISAGWELHDESLTNKRIMRSPYVDDETRYKIVEIEVNASYNSYLYLYGYELWNLTSHTGTNKTSNATNFPQRLNLTTGGTIYIFSSARFMAFLTNDGTNWGDSSYQGMSLAVEFSRDQPYQAVVNGYPQFAIILSGYAFQGGKYCYMPRTRDLIGSDRIGTAAELFWATVGCGYGNWSSNTNFPQGSNAKVRDLSGNMFIPMFPLFLVDPVVYVMPLGNVSSIADVWALPKDAIAHLETFRNLNDEEYIAVQGNNQGMRLGFRKG
jgi:hypothetical protein